MYESLGPRLWSTFTATTVAGAVALSPLPVLAAGTDADPVTATDGEAAAQPAPELQAPPQAQGPEVAAQGPYPAQPPPPQPPPRQDYPNRTGLGGLIAGSILLGIGLPIAITGGVYISRGTKKATTDINSVDDGADVVEGGLSIAGGAALATLGGVMSVVGIPLLAVGAVRYSRYADWKKTHQARLVPTMQLSRKGASSYGVGYSLKF